MKDIPGYEGRYAVTSCGKVWSYKSKKFISQKMHRNGYLSVMLCKQGKMKRYLVHRLVACAYLKNPNNFPQVNHKDEVKSNNFINNLEWCTRQYNNTFGTVRERIAKIQGKKVVCAETGEVFYSIGDASRKTGITRSLIAQCCRMEVKRAKHLHFYFKEAIS